MPGLYTLETDRGARNRWKNGDKVRFFRGMPQKLAGWAKATVNTFLGVCRAALDWQTYTYSHVIALGTHLKLYVYSGGNFNNVTPIRSSGNIANPFTTTINLTLVKVTHTGHGCITGDTVSFSGAAAVGGITINGAYTVTSVQDADNYFITHSSQASGSAGPGGGAAVGYSYEINVGRADTTMSRGWGAATWGYSTWGTARGLSAFISMNRVWTLDTWGEDLIACPRGGSIYLWDASAGVGTRATILGSAPVTAKAIIMSLENRHLIALGAHNGVADDPMYIRWCSSADYTDWTPSSTNSAGNKRLDQGTEIYCGIKVGKEILVHTDSAFTSMVFEGTPYTFGFTPKGGNGKLAGPAAAKEFDGRGWWMGENDFFVYDGRMRVLPCDVRNHVFDDFNKDQKTKVFAGANQKYGEVWWLYPSALSTECDRYVIYNAWENHWSFGTLNRTAIIADSKVFDPYGVDSSGYLYNHESGVDDADSAMAASLDTWDIEVGDGDYVMHISKIVPDFKTLTGSATVTVKGKKYPHTTSYDSQSAGDISPTTEFLNPHLRARQISLNIAMSQLGDDFRMGTLRIEAKPDGKQ